MNASWRHPILPAKMTVHVGEALALAGREGAAVNHYQVLGVSVSSSSRELRRAYVQMARQYHPDFHLRSGPSAVECAEHRMREINLAWDILRDDAKRRDYDRRLGLAMSSAVRT